MRSGLSGLVATIAETNPSAFRRVMQGASLNRLMALAAA
jgi:hypothetical protein